MDLPGAVSRRISPAAFRAPAPEVPYCRRDAHQRVPLPPLSLPRGLRDRRIQHVPTWRLAFSNPTDVGSIVADSLVARTPCPPFPFLRGARLLTSGSPRNQAGGTLTPHPTGGGASPPRSACAMPRAPVIHSECARDDVPRGSRFRLAAPGQAGARSSPARRCHGPSVISPSVLTERRPPPRRRWGYVDLRCVPLSCWCSCGAHRWTEQGVGLQVLCASLFPCASEMQRRPRLCQRHKMRGLDNYSHHCTCIVGGDGLGRDADALFGFQCDTRLVITN